MKKILIVFMVLAPILLFANNNDNEQELCSDAEVEIGLGKNSPQSSNSIIIPKDNGGKPLVVGQFTLQGPDCEEGKYFSFEDLRVQFDKKNDSNFEFSNYELIWDVDGNGSYDATVDSIVSDSSATTENTNFVYFALKQSSKKYLGKSLNSFIIRANIDYKGITSGTSFHFFLEEGAVGAKNKAGAATVSGVDIKFAEFYLEPTGDYFIATIGPKDPAIPSVAEMNNNIPVMQIRTKSIGQANSIKKFKIKIPSNAVKFGDKNGITGISLWLDTNNDGIGDIKIAEKTTFESGESNSIMFEEFSQPLTYIADEEKYIVVKVDFNMIESDPAMFGQIFVLNGGIRLEDASATMCGLPLYSKIYEYSCDPNFEECSSSGSGNKEADSENDSDKDDNNNEYENKQGELYGECYPNNTCNKNLVCNTTNNICLKEESKSSHGCSVLVF